MLVTLNRSRRPLSWRGEIEQDRYAKRRVRLVLEMEFTKGVQQNSHVMLATVSSRETGPQARISIRSFQSWAFLFLVFARIASQVVVL